MTEHISFKLHLERNPWSFHGVQRGETECLMIWSPKRRWSHLCFLQAISNLFALDGNAITDRRSPLHRGIKIKQELIQMTRNSLNIDKISNWNKLLKGTNDHLLMPSERGQKREQPRSLRKVSAVISSSMGTPHCLSASIPLMPCSIRKWNLNKLKKHRSPTDALGA